MKLFHSFIIFNLFLIFILIIYFSNSPFKKKEFDILITTQAQPVGPTNITAKPSEYRILLWTKYFSGNEWPKQNLRQLKCQFSNCVLTSDRSLLYASDALLFHWWDFSLNDMPVQHYNGQKWVLFNWEAVGTSPVEKIIPIADRIDWLMSYQRDADIYVPYGVVKKCNTTWNKEDMFDNKTKEVAWVVSNCDTLSKREDYVNELKKYIEVDVFGGCGNHKCSRDGDQCFRNIEKTYKFYLAFENTLCKDYVTEKLFRTLEYDIIPVVYGYADYKYILPKDSFINVLDFISPKSLAKYLKTVSKDKQKYNSHMIWRKNYCSERTHYKYLCKLCEKLNENVDNRAKVTNGARTILDQWNVKEQCYRP